MNKANNYYWLAYMQFNGEDTTSFVSYSFRVTKKQYQKIQKAIDKKIPLCSCDFCQELENRALDLYFKSALKNIEKPRRKDYEDLDEYEYALEDYQSEVDALDDVTVARVDIDDPNDVVRLKELFIGKRFSALEGKACVTEQYDFEEYSDREVRYSVKISTDSDSKVSDVEVVQSDGLCSESVRSSSYYECYPDYGFIAEALLEELGEEL